LVEVDAGGIGLSRRRAAGVVGGREEELPPAGKTTWIADPSPSEDLLAKAGGPYATILADPPWQFQNRTGKMAPEHRRLLRYPTMELEEVMGLPISKLAAAKSHLYLWVPNALLPQGLEVMAAWGFAYKTNLVWYKVRKDGGPDGRGVGFYFRNVTELLLFGVRGSMRTLGPGRTQVNLLPTRKREHSRKPDEVYEIIEDCSPGPYFELFARFVRPGWHQWGNEDVEANSLQGTARRELHRRAGFLDRANL
jgi:N6-adenosine-specific RNA methylase IME4